MKQRSKEYQRLVALAAEANRRGISYGQLMAGTTEYERNQIVRKRQKTYTKGGAAGVPIQEIHSGEL